MELKAPSGLRASRSVQHQRQCGVTLIELLVSMSILVAIAGSIAGAFTIGFRAIGAGGAGARLGGDNDVIAFEQQIGADVNRAVCLASPAMGGSAAVIPTGGCQASINRSSGNGGSTCAAGYVLCLAWSARLPSGSVCHTISYVPSGDGAYVLRTDSAGGSNASARISTGMLSFKNRDGTIGAEWTPVATSTSASGTAAGYSWTKEVDLTITQTGSRVRNPVGPTVFALVPFSADPLSPAVSTAC